MLLGVRHLICKDTLQRGQTPASFLQFDKPSLAVRHTSYAVGDACLRNAAKLIGKAAGCPHTFTEIPLYLFLSHAKTLLQNFFDFKHCYKKCCVYIGGSNSKGRFSMQHSKIVGGSTAKRVIACPGSVALVDSVPPKPSSSYADEGTLLHDTIASILESDLDPYSLVGTTYEKTVLTEALVDDKLIPALRALDEIDPKGEMEYAVESRVGFGDFLPDVFGSTDLLGRIGDRAVVLDWKFGDGVAVEVEENSQLLFYAAAAKRTAETAWAFKDAKEVELIIVQPPYVKRWVTDLARVDAFEKELAAAVKVAMQPNAPLASGDHCKWCAAKPVCPIMTGAVDRALKAKLEALPVEQIAHYLEQAPLIEGFIKDLQQLAHGLLEEGQKVPGWKLVNKRATRQWTNEDKAEAWMEARGIYPLQEPKLKSPAQAEKDMKKMKEKLPDDLVVAVSTGSTLAPENDPRPEVLQIGQMLTKAMSKLQ
jgi:hypothetical protein